MEEAVSPDAKKAGATDSKDDENEEVEFEMTEEKKDAVAETPEGFAEGGIFGTISELFGSI